MRIDRFDPFVGQHCETTATGNLLRAAGLPLSEPMLYGLGEGLAFGVFAFKGQDAPFLGGRPQPEEITRTLASRLGLEVDFRQSRAPKRAWANIAEFVDAGVPVAAKVNMRLLDFDTSGVDFAAHYVTVYDYDERDAFVVDTAGVNKTSRESLEQARLWKGPMASNALTWTLSATPAQVDWAAAVRGAIAANARTYLNPPIANFGAKGIRKAAKLLPTWTTYAPSAIAELGTIMEHGGTGGGLFRPMYAAFLREAHEHLGDATLLASASEFDAAGALWTEASDLLCGYPDVGPTALTSAGAVLVEIAAIEEGAVGRLASLEGPD